MLIDYRCPKCDGIIVGTESVVEINSKPKDVIVCPHCSTKLKVEQDSDNYLGKFKFVGGGICYFVEA